MLAKYRCILFVTMATDKNYMDAFKAYSDGKHADDLLLQVLDCVKKAFGSELPPMQELILLGDADIKSMVGAKKGRQSCD